jgi:hypothetical protein
VAPDDEDLEPYRLEAAAEIVDSIGRIEKLMGGTGRAGPRRRFDAIAVNALLAAAFCAACAAVAIASLIG